MELSIIVMIALLGVVSLVGIWSDRKAEKLREAELKALADLRRANARSMRQGPRQ